MIFRRDRLRYSLNPSRLILMYYAWHTFCPFRFNIGDENHIPACVIAIKVNADILLQDRGGKRAEILSEFNIRVNKMTRLGLSWIGQYASMSERPGTEFTTTLKPSHNLPLS